MDEPAEAARGEGVARDARLRGDAFELNVMANTIELDVRGLEAPEPLVRVLDALAALPTTDSLLLKIDCRPLPLFRILERNGYVYDVQPGSDSLFEISIRKRESA